MIFKNLRLAARFGKAHGMLLNKDYDRSYYLLVSILDSGPEEFMIPLLYEDLGIVEYSRGNYSESMRYMDFCIKDSCENPDLWSHEDDAERIERVHWYYKASTKKLAEEKA